MQIFEQERVSVKLCTTEEPPISTIRPEVVKLDRIDSVHIEPLRKPLNKASVNKVNALNLADVRMQIDEEYVPGYLAPDASRVPQEVELIEQHIELQQNDELQERKVSVLNAPMQTEESLPALVATAIQIQPIVSHELAEFISEESNDNKSQLKKLDYKKKPLTLNAPILAEQERLLPPPIQFQSNQPTIQNPLQSSYIAPYADLHQPAHVLVPVNINNAETGEYEEQEVIEFEVNENVNAGNLVPKREEMHELGRASVTQPRDLSMPLLKHLEMEKTENFQVQNVESLNLKEIKQGK